MTRALFYLEGRHAYNQLRAVLRSPARLALWIPYVIFLAVLTIRRILLASEGHAGFFTQSGQALETAAAGTFIGMLGATIAFAAAGRVVAFRSAAEALLFNNAGIPPLATAIWLQLRKLASTGPRWLGSLIFTFLLITPANAGVGELISGFIAALAVAATIMTAELPAFLLARKHFGAAVGWFGWFLALSGGAFAGVGFAASLGEPHALALLQAVPFDPGDIVREVISNPIALILLCCGPMALVGAIEVLGRDAIPELYSATLQAFEWRARRRNPLARTPAVSERTERVPPGALAIVWKDWIGFRRSPDGLLRIAFGVIFWLFAGSALIYASSLGDRSLAWPLLGFGLTIVVLVPLIASVSLVEDLSKPLWWISADSLRSRMFAWTFAKSWRGGLAAATAPVTIFVYNGDAVAAIVSIPVVVGLWCALTSLGVGLYAAYPSRLDSKGPIFVLRALATALFFMPPAIAFGFVALATRSPAFGLTGAAIVVAGEAFLAIEFAVTRFSHNGAGIASLERA